MKWWWSRSRPEPPAGPAMAGRIRAKYAGFRELLTCNNECLELMAGLQEDLQYAPPLADVLGGRVEQLFQTAGRIVASLEALTGRSYPVLAAALEDQRDEVERYLAACGERPMPRMAARISEIYAADAAEVGGKAAALGEVRNRARLPVPDGFVLTTEAYRQFCGLPLWRVIRDALQDVDLNDAAALGEVSERLAAAALALPVPPPLAAALTERAAALGSGGVGLAVRSSAVAEGGARTCAGQFLTLLNVPAAGIVEAYKQVVAARFSRQALFYRLSTGLAEADSAMAVLVLPMIRARASGIMYTRDPSDPRSRTLWITATRGLGLEVASGRTAADLYVVGRGRPHDVVETSIVSKPEQLTMRPGGGLDSAPVAVADAALPSLAPADAAALAALGVRLEEHFHAPQDVEWAIDDDGRPWILQSRNLALVTPVRTARAKAAGDPLMAGGRTVYPGRVSGPAYLAETLAEISAAPPNSLVFIRRPSPEIVSIFPRIGGLVAEWGNVTGHAAALLREFKVPSVFLLPGAFGKLRSGEPASLDAVQRAVYRGTLYPSRRHEAAAAGGSRDRAADPISARILKLHLLDPSGSDFRPSGCKSTHDVIRFCHEKAIEAMFTVNDVALDRGGCVRPLATPVPVNICVLDLGGGLAPSAGTSGELQPSQIVSRPFQAFWKGVTHPQVSWTREMPASLSDLVSVVTASLAPADNAMRGLGEKSYLLVADEYMNLNSRLAYHYSLVDACLSDSPSKNYVAMRFEGGGATRDRRHLRACFIEACLTHYGFIVDRRGDLVNAWFKKAPAPDTADRLDILGRLMASSSQLDMFMTGRDVMLWYVRQFQEGNYSFRRQPAP